MVPSNSTRHDIPLQKLDIPTKTTGNPEADVFSDCLVLLSCKEMKVCFQRKDRQCEDDEAEAMLETHKKVVREFERKGEVGDLTNSSRESSSLYFNSRYSCVEFEIHRPS